MTANRHHARMKRSTAGRSAARVLVSCAASLFTTAGAWAQAIPPDEDDVSLHVDSGLVQNSTRQRDVIFSTVVAAPGAPWLRLSFDQAHLGPVALGGEETILRITSLSDGAEQNMNAAHLEQWEYTSAYFNGDVLLIEIIADPSAEPSRLVCTHAWAGPPEPAEPETICGPDDDRILSYDNRSCRTRPTTCTAWIFDDANHMVLTAGHCAAGTINVVQFNVPLSDPNGSVNHPGPEDQYAVDQSSLQYQSAGSGNDWGYFGIFRNTETGLMPYEAYGDYHTTSLPPPVSGQDIRITGYGVVSAPISPTWRCVQKTHVGPYWYFGDTLLCYRTDTTGGNSGSAVQNLDTGHAIGIHTHGGCDNTPNTCNRGTGLNHAALQSALANPQGACIPTYCQAAGGCDEFIYDVQLCGTYNTTGCSRYADYPQYTNLMFRGLGYGITVTNGSQNWPQDRCGIWVDWNRDEDFTDPGEAMYVNGSPGVGPYTAVITPPSWAPLGETRMRIRITYGEPLSPCDVTTYGEVEDYRINVTDLPSYCLAGAQLFDEWIQRVQVGVIDNITGWGTGGYQDWTALSTEMQVGAGHSITVTNGTTMWPSDQCGIWVDWNQDYDFYDAGETIAVNGTPGTGPYTATITPPAGTPLGATRMRIRIAASGLVDPCGVPTYGEVEDYTVMVTPGDYCEASSGCGQYISRVEFAGMDNSSDCDEYINYGNLPGDVYFGLSYPITITVANGYVGNSGGLWVDWNQDFDFFDPGEEIDLSPAWGPGPYTALVAVPPDALPGFTRMRVRLHREVEWPEPCQYEPFGEVEDYVLDVAESPYCLALSECDQYISRVQLGAIDNASQCAAGWYGYSDFTHLITELIPGVPTPLTITLEYSEPGDRGAAWIDWNRDLDFDDPGEAIALNGTPGVGPYTATVDPPPDAMPGAMRLRVRSVRDHDPVPCGEQSIGETEDYTILLVPPTHCAAWAECDAYISRVEIGAIDNPSDCHSGYSNYTSQSTVLAIGAGTPLTITVGNAAGYEHGAVFIDWNQDGELGYPSEEVPLTGTPGPGPYTATITVPPDAVPGSTLLRVRVSGEEDPPGPCGPTETGEVEDYTVLIAAGPSCPADINEDGVVDVLDLLALLAAWGNPGGPEDINGDGIVDVLDLLELLAAWGPCPEAGLRVGGR